MVFPICAVPLGEIEVNRKMQSGKKFPLDYTNMVVELQGKIEQSSPISIVRLT
jgi:hypothetical protein